MKYEARIVKGNGYHCGCCRSEYTYEEEFETIEALKKWFVEFEAETRWYKISENPDLYNYGDRYIDYIKIVEDTKLIDELNEELKSDINNRIEEVNLIFEENKSRELRKEHEEEEREEKEIFKRLKQKFEE